MADNESSHLMWIIIVLAVASTIFMGLKVTFPGLLSQVTDKMVRGITGVALPITHTAYAFSPDGTDRFSIVKPNYNLLANSSFDNASGWNQINYTYSNQSILLEPDGFKNNGLVKNSVKLTRSTITGANVRWQLVQPLGSIGTIRPGDIYTLSGWIKVNSDVKLSTTFSSNNISVRLNNFDADSQDDILRYDFSQQKENEWVYFKVSSKIPLKSSGFNQLMVSLHEFGSVSVAQLKLEKGSEATQCLPSESEFKPSDYAPYVGTYVDGLNTQSNDPTKYTWIKS